MDSGRIVRVYYSVIGPLINFTFPGAHRNSPAVFLTLCIALDEQGDPVVPVQLDPRYNIDVRLFINLLALQCLGIQGLARFIL